MYAVHKLLWDVRREPAVAARFRADPDALLDDYGLTGEERDAMRSLDVQSLYDAGANPYLLYFCALQLGMSRQDYYARIRGEQP
jgi:Aromatic-ring-opening dioxygenase LigAB, LigA subunit